MVTDVGNILSGVQLRQLNAVRSTAKTLDTSELRLATGRRVNSVLDNPQSFFAARGLSNRASDLQRLLDGIGQGLQVIRTAEDGIQGALGILDNAESFLNQTARDIDDGILDGPPTIIPGAGPPLPGDLTTAVNDILAANPGSITEGGGVIVQRYDTPGAVTFTAPVGVTDIEYLVVGGGGGGGSSTAFSNGGSGGGGGGGVVTGMMTVAGPINITIGAGGNAGAAGNNSGQQGGATTFGTITALGGGFGIGGNGSGGPGGSGGGGRGGTAGTGLQAGSGSGGLGNDGGTGASPAGAGGGGGGGAAGVGGALSNVSGGDGGAGFTFTIDGVDEFFGAGGGGGGAQNDPGGTGGSGAGGTGASNGTAATAGLNGTGGGGGGGNNNRVGARGGDGAVIIRYTVIAAPSGNADLVITPQQKLEMEYEALLEQLDLLVLDSEYRGTDLLDGDDLTLFFNESRTSSLTIEGISASSAALGLEFETLGSIDDVSLRIEEIREARETLRLYGSSLTNDLNITKIREQSLNTTINVLEEGSDKLTLVDQNEEGARLLSLAVRQQIQLSVLAIRAPSLVDFLF